MLPPDLPALSAPTDGRVVYAAESFSPYAPATAFDMVSHVPGFRIQDGDDRRGYSGALGNVLIDSVHPNSKTETLEDALKRIPARQVVRIEVWRDGDTSGGGTTPTVLVNVVRVPSALGGVWSFGIEDANTGQPPANGYAAISGRYRKLTYSVGASAYALRRDLPGYRTVRDGDGALLATIQDVSPRTFDQHAVNGDLGYPVAGGQLRVNAALFASQYADRSEAFTYTPQLSQDDRNPYGEDHRSAELGLHFDRPVLGGELTFAGASTRKRFDSAIVADTLGPDGVRWSRFSQTVRHDSGEDIVRADFSRAAGRNHHIDAGVETAINRLTAAAVVSLDLGAGPQALNLPNANIRIVEHRTETFVSDTWTPRPAWSVESRLAYEASRLDFSGDTEASVQLAYVKPSLQISHEIGRQQIRFKIARDVGQLNFDDFTSAEAVADGRLNGGNPGLRPQTAWHSELAFDGRFQKETTASIRLFHDDISDAADLIPIIQGGLTYDAPGNIGKGSIVGAQVTAHLPIAWLPGAAFDIDATARRSQVTDPTTGRTRSLSNLPDRILIAHFRQDIPMSPYAWGIDYANTSAARQFYANEVDSHQDSPSLDLFAEVRLPKTIKLTAYVKSALGSPETRTRTFYDNRPAGAVNHVEDRRSFPGHWLYVTLSGAF